MFQQTRLATRIALAFGIAILTFGLVVGLTSIGVSRSARALEEIVHERYPSTVALHELHEAETDTARAYIAVAHRRLDPARRHQLLNEGAAALARYDEGLARYDAAPKSPEAQRAWSIARAALHPWRVHAQRLLDLERRRQDSSGTAADALDEEIWPALEQSYALFEATEAPLRTLVALEEDAVRAQGDHAADTAAWLQRTLASGGLIAFACLLAMGATVIVNVRRGVRALTAQASRLTTAVQAGQLEVRADPDAVGVDFRPVIAGMNATMDAFLPPIRLATDYVSRISNGDLPPKIDERWNGDFDEIKEALNRCIDALGRLVADTQALADAGVEGRLETRADASRHQGVFRRVVEGLNGTLDAVIEPLEVAAACVDGLARGAVPPPIAAEFRGDYGVLKQNLNRCIAALRALLADTRALAAATVDGQLSVRADPSRHEGDYAEIIRGLNEAVEAIVGPFRVIADYCERISHGELPEHRTQSVRGEIEVAQRSVNRCLESLGALVADTEALVAAALDGRLATRADLSRHEGAFRRTLDGVNRTLDVLLAPVEEATRVLERLADRDLRARMHGAYRGDHARLKDALNGTANALHDALVQVAEAAGQVSSASSQIASSSQAVASGASEQASALEETSTTIESVAGLSRAAADNAQQATRLAQGAREAAGHGTAAVEQLKRAMAEIKASAEDTSQIIKDINEIAFQTNLLALNAAVEAARAGEAGRGFAVVAEEVRSLALRAKDAATKTDELIRRSVNEAGGGEVSAKLVEDRLGEIVAGIGKVSDIVAEIAAAAREQSSGIEGVNKAVAEMDKVTQQNAASAEESSSAAAELAAQAEELSAMVTSFQLERRGNAGVVAPRPAPHAAPAVRPNGAGYANGTARSARALAEAAFPMDAKDDF